MKRTPTNRYALPILFMTAIVFGYPGLLSAQDFPLLPDDGESVTAVATKSNDAFLGESNTPKTLDQLRQLEQTFADVIEQVAPATVNIMVEDAQGSGVVISRDGYILTAAHVITRPNKTATITFADGSTASAITLGVNKTYDSGMLKITDKGKWTFVDIGESRDLKQGQWVMSIGHPGGLTEGRGLVYRAGRILKTPTQSDDVFPWFGNNESAIVTDCALVGGDSGGPLVDLNGYVVGIHSRIGGRLTENFHVPIDAFSKDWDELVESAIVGSKSPYLGVNLDRKKPEVVIREVFPNEGAKKAGMKVGDIVIKVNDVKTPDQKSFRAAMKKYKPKDVITVLVKRDDEEIELTVTLGYK